MYTRIPGHLGLLLLLATSLNAEKIQVPIHYAHAQMIDKPKRISAAPYLSGDSFRAICDFHVDEVSGELDTDLIKKGGSFFVNTTYLPFFISQVLPHIHGSFVLVTHNDIKTIPGKYNGLLSDKRLIKWYGKNGDASAHPKVVPIPIGLANQCWPHGNVSTVKQVQGMQADKVHLLYLNINEKTHRSRPIIQEQFAKYDWVKEEKKVPFHEYLYNLKCSDFALSPRGAGEDCHRTWEAFYMGSIPIIKSSFLDPLFDDLPVLIIDDFSVITPDFLAEKKLEIEAKTLNMKKLYIDYWDNLINSHK